MSKELENHKELVELKNRRFSLSWVSGHIVVNDIFYLNEAGELGKGKLAVPLNLITPEKLGAPKNHQMFWSGSDPYFLTGDKIPLGKGSANVDLAGTKYTKNLSNKPPDKKFESYTELIEHYTYLISGPAMDKFNVDPLTGAEYDVPEENSAFKIHDTFSAKAEITDLNQFLGKDKIAIVGLGGTGSYVLDFMAKTPVHSIDAFDFDVFEVHNGFRSPGEVVGDDFGSTKVDVYKRKYDNLKHRLTFHSKKVTGEDDEFFKGITFAFICIDDGESRAKICDMFIRMKIPFIDVGMGIEKENGSLDGLIRTTVFTDENIDRARSEIPTDKVEEEGAYRVFVQIAELNALNASIAVICYKKFRGFYCNENQYYQNIISLGSSNWIGEL